MELTCRTVNGVQIPNLRLPKQKYLPIGKYGMMRHDFLEKHRKGTYTTLLTEFRLQEHLYEVDQEAKRQVEELTLLLVSGSGIDECLKNTDPLRWVQEMNLAKTSAEEIVLKEIIYQ